jgi:uncharacterized damage-inducible protein DinB
MQIPLEPSPRLESFLRYYAHVRRRTLAVAGVFPLDRLEWRPAPGRFSSGDILRHLAGIERYMFVENACLRPSRYPGHGIELGEGPALFEYLDRTHRESLDLLGALDDPALDERCTTPGGAGLPVWKWLRSMIEHEAHHRGQLYSYAADLGLQAPPLYGLTSEEVLERSAPPA